MKRFTYETNCTLASGPDIEAMVDKSREIKRATFVRRVDPYDLRTQEELLGYEARRRDGLTMQDDWHVRYFRSEYQGRPCYFFSWSAIEHIFT